jgi:NAD(P)-dependent dehydrogenase (short-subunit alcohol dehydrogenase family)
VRESSVVSGRLAGQVAMVVGAGSVGPGWGNGKATAVLFAREGASVLCVDIDEEAARETAAIIRGEGGQADACAGDASSSDDVQRAVERCVGRFGGLDVLDNNVGIFEEGGVVDLPEERWNRVLAVNLTSFFLAMKHAVPAMERRGGGAIVNISSIAALRHTGPGDPSVAYSTTKAAVNHLTSTAAIECAPKGIRVNAILPGLMRTPMVDAMRDELVAGYGVADAEQLRRARDAQCPLGHQGDAWDVARAAVFLASSEARYITGVALVVDGGLTLTGN